MAWIKTLGPDDDPIVKQIHDERMKTWGYFSNVMQVFSAKPQVLKRLMDFQSLVTFGGSSLGRRREELISFHVSALNQCEY